MIPEQVIEIIRALGYLLGLCIGCILYSYVRTLIYNSKYQNLYNEVVTIVRSMEQVYSSQEGAKKKRDALDHILTYAEKIGLKITVEQASALIEGVVYGIKHSKHSVENK